MILERIVARKRQEVAELKAKGLEPLPMEVEPPRGFIAAVTGYDGISLIAEAKKASPSKGVICADFDPVAIADRYERGGGPGPFRLDR